MRQRSMMLLAAFLLLAGSASAATYGKYDVTASHVHRTGVNLTAGQHVTLETYNLSGSSDTVMHLLSPGGQEVAMNDDYSGTASRIDYDVPSSGIYVVVVRAWNTALGGTCSLKMNGTPIDTNFPFRGYLLAGGTTASDTVQTALLNQGTDDTMLYGLDSGGHLLAVDDDSGVGYASKISGAFYWVVVATYGWTEGLTRAYLNDAGNDHDGDGLGGQLEVALCLCDQSSGQYSYSCGQYCLSAYVRDTKDSDGDGIRDEYEVFGKEDASFPQHLPKWGADPSHKDLFVEIDRVTGVGFMNSQQLDKLVAAYAPPRSTQAYLQNRDGLPGIRIHADVGVTSTGTSYGNWGGSSFVPPGTNYNTPSESQFALVRRGMFHYGIATGGGSCNGAVDGTGYCASVADGLMHGHELGHNLSLDHGGSVSTFPANSKPHYKSIMNYAFSGGQVTTTFSFNDFSYLTLNPDDLCEANGLGTSDRSKVAYLEGQSYYYLVEAVCNSDGNANCGVDWNRDGVISGCDKHIKAAVNYQFAGGSELGRYWWQREEPPFTTANADATAAPSLMRFAGRLYLAFRTNNQEIKLWYTSHADFKTGCGDPWVGCGNVCPRSSCAAWTPLTVQSVSQDGGPALGVINYGGQDRLVVVWRGTTGGNPVLKYVTVNVQDQISSVSDVPGSGTNVIYEPSLASNGGDLVLTYLKGTEGATGTVYGNTWVAGQTAWGSAAIQYSGGVPLTALSVMATASHPGGLRGVFGYLYSFMVWDAKWMSYNGNNTWTLVTGYGLKGSFSALPKKRAGLAYLAHPPSTGLSGGRWYFVFPVTPGYAGSKVDITMTKGDGATSGTLEWLNLTFYDNEWHYVRGGVALYAWRPGNAESNLRLATVFARDPTTGNEPLEFRPFADGILAASMKDCNDWMLTERGLCTSLNGCTCKTTGGCVYTSSPACLLSGETDWCDQHP